MTLQQLRYMIQVAQTGSINLAAQVLFISQPSLSKAISDLEKEMGVTMFYRDSRGVSLSEDGAKFLSYARQVVEQADLLEQEYKHKEPVRRVFSISSQHFAFVVNAFVSLVQEYDRNRYEFTLRESRTYDILEDVANRRSEIGVLYLSKFNRNVLTKMIRENDLTFCPLFRAGPHVFLSRNHPLAGHSQIHREELQDYPCLTYEQGVHNSFYFSEELHSIDDHPKSIVVTDRATLFNLLIGLNGYTISSGILSTELNGDNIVSVPLDSDEEMEIGYIRPSQLGLTPMSARYIQILTGYIQENYGDIV